MANFNAVNYNLAYIADPVEKIDVVEHKGKVRRMYDSYTLGAELAIGETIAFFKLPANAKIVDARLIAPVDPDASPTGQLDVGWLDNGTDGAAADGLFDGLTEGDVGGGAVDSKLKGTSAGFNKSFSAETEIVITGLEATKASTGNKIQLELYYVIE
jgi:hypothetical protein